MQLLALELGRLRPGLLCLGAPQGCFAKGPVNQRHPVLPQGRCVLAVGIAPEQLRGPSMAWGEVVLREQPRFRLVPHRKRSMRSCHRHAPSSSRNLPCLVVATTIRSRSSATPRTAGTAPPSF